MHHYFFDIADGDDRTLDDVGVDFANEDAARTHAASLLIELARDEIRVGEVGVLAVEVRSSTGQPMFYAALHLQFSEGPSGRVASD